MNTKPKRRRVVMRRKNQLTLPSDVAEALHIREGDEVEFDIGTDGRVVLQGMTTVPADQRWFWESAWQAGEHEAGRQIAADQTTAYGDAEAMFEDLEKER